jgi:hypothetical protein
VRSNAPAESTALPSKFHSDVKPVGKAIIVSPA